MKVIICGAGQVGFGIASHLVGEGNDVTVVDHAPELIERIHDRLDVRPVVGLGAHPHILEDAGAAEADIVIAVTPSDEVNMLTCEVAKSNFNVKKCIARVGNRNYFAPDPPHNFDVKGVPIDVVISPERAVGDTVLRRLDVPAAFDNANFADGLVQLIGITIEDDCPVIDTPLNQLTGLFPDLQAIVVGVRRDGAVYVPEFDDLITAGDLVYLVVATKDTNRTLKIFGHEEKEARRLIIVGAGNIGLQVAHALERRGGRGYSIRMIEADAKRAQAVAESVARAVVMQGDGLSPELLAEAGVRDTELILALTNDEQVNVLTTMLALQEGCQRGLCLLNSNSFQKLANRSAMEMAINPRAVTVSSVLAHVRRAQIIGLHTIGDGEAEVIETRLDEGSALLGERIRDWEFPDGVRIGALMRKNEVITPRGNTEFKLGDHVILFVMAEQVEYAERLFAPRELPDAG